MGLKKDKNKLVKAVAEITKEIEFESLFRATMHGSKSRVVENLNRLSYKEIDELENICYQLQMIINETGLKKD